VHDLQLKKLQLHLLSHLAAHQDTRKRQIRANWDVYRLNPLETGRLIKALGVQCRVAVQFANAE